MSGAGEVDTRNQSARRRSITTGRLRRDLQHEVKAQLRELIGELAGEGTTQLPSEEELSDRLGVSRATLRSVLLTLQKEGVIQRVHGWGTFINRHALRIRANIAQDSPFIDLLARIGYTASTRIASLRVEDLDSEAIAPLELDAVEDACVVMRIFDADGSPAVLCVDYVPARYLVTPVEDLLGEESVFEFVRLHTGRRVRYSVADIVPAAADPEVASLLQVEDARPLMLLRHTHVDESDQPVAFTRAYVNDRFVRFSVVRTYLDA